MSQWGISACYLSGVGAAGAVDGEHGDPVGLVRSPPYPPAGVPRGAECHGDVAVGVRYGKDNGVLAHVSAASR